MALCNRPVVVAEGRPLPRGIGAALISAVLNHAGLRAKSAVTLRTFLTTGWSVGLYEKLGFRRWDPDPPPGWLEVLMAGEIAIGLRPDERFSMRRLLTP